MDGQHLNQPGNNQNNQQILPNDNNSINNVEEPLKKRTALTFEEISPLAAVADDAMSGASLRLRGSEEYDHAHDEFRKAQERWKAHKPDEPFTEQEARELRSELYNSLYLIDTYLGKKHKENDKSKNAGLRIRAMQMGFNLLEQQIYALDLELDKIVAREQEPVSGLATTSRDNFTKIENAKLRLRGSSEFDKATTSFELVVKKLEELNKKYGEKEDYISSAELDELNSLIDTASYDVNEYTQSKVGETISDNTHKRVDAMTGANTLLRAAKRKVESLQAAKDEIREKDFEALKNAAYNNNTSILEAENGVHFGSDEYKNAKNDYKIFTDYLLDKFYDDPEVKFTRRDLDDLARLAQKSADSIDTYLKGKYGQDLGPKTQKRVDAMREAKENLVQVQKKCKILMEKRMSDVSKTSTATLQESENLVLDDVKTAKNRVNGSRVWFGGEDYDTAMTLFEKAVTNEAKLDESRKNNSPSEYSLRTQLTELKKAQDATRVYIERKEKEMKKNGKLDDKGTERLADMKKAYDCLGKRIDRAQFKLDEINAKEKAEGSKAMDDYVDKKRAEIPGKSGFDKVMAIQAALDASILRDMSKRRSLTSVDQERVRSVVASMMLRQKIESGVISKPNPPTLQGLQGAIDTLYNSAEFKKATSGIITPAIARKVVTNPQMVEKMSKKFTDILKENVAKGQFKSKNIKIKMVNENEIKNSGPKK